VSTVLGLLGFVLYVAAIIGLAAGVTWIVVRWTPSKKPSGPAQS
jgi:H+/Cl- antiporter ClcA